MKPLIRWAGSKRRALPNLCPYWSISKKKKYIEPFCGSAALFFELEPRCAVLNDTNENLINLYRQLRKSPIKIHRAVGVLNNDPDTYYKLRSQNEDQLSTFEKAVRFIYLNRYCFNGIYRENQKGHFNVPYGGERVGKFPSASEFRKAAKLLRSATLKTRDFERLLNDEADGTSFVYLDPPYAVSNARVFRQYSPSSFGRHDIKRLFEVLARIDQKGASFLLSYADSEEIEPFKQRWNFSELTLRRSVAGFSKHRKSAVEVLITNIRDVNI